MKKVLLLFIMITASLSAQVVRLSDSGVTYVLSAPFGSCNSYTQAQSVIGPGTFYTCQSNVWSQVASSSGGTWGSITGTLSSQTDLQTALNGKQPAGSYAVTNGSNTFTTGTQDFSGAAHTLPAKKGLAASKPATCTVGEEYFATDATAGQNKYYCTATNTWTQQSGTGSSGLSGMTAGQIPIAATGTTVTSSVPTNSGPGYTVYNVSGTYYARNNLTQAIDYSGSDYSVIDANIKTANAGACGKILFEPGTFNLNSLTAETVTGFTNIAYAIGNPATAATNQICEWEYEGTSFSVMVNGYRMPVQTSGTVLNVTSTALSSVSSSTHVTAIWDRPNTSTYLGNRVPGAMTKFKNIIVRFPDNTRGNETCIDVTQGWMNDYDHVVCDLNVAEGSMIFPTAGANGMIGLTTTMSEHGENNWLNAYCFGFDQCFDVQSEHSVIQNSFAVYCNYAFQYGVNGVTSMPVYIPSMLIDSGWGDCAHGLQIGNNVQNGANLEIEGLDIEDAASGTWAPVWRFKEVNSGYTSGRISGTHLTINTGITSLSNLFDGGGGVNFNICGFGTPCNAPVTAITTTGTSGAATITRTNGVATINIPQYSGGGGNSQVAAVSSSTTMSASSDYVANCSSQCTFTLPATAAYGSTNTVCGEGAGGWLIVPGGGQILAYQGTLRSSISSQNIYDCVTLKTIVANATFSVENATESLTATTYQDLATFAGTAGTNVTAYTDNSGNTFTQNTADSVGGGIITLTGTGGATNTNGVLGNYAAVLSSLLPSSADQTITVTAAPTGSSYYLNILGRYDTATPKTYQVQCADTFPGCKLLAYYSGSAHQIGSTYAISWGAGVSHSVALKMVGTTISMYVDGASQASGTDSNITANQKPGIQIRGQSEMTITQWSVQ